VTESSKHSPPCVGCWRTCPAIREIRHAFECLEERQSARRRTRLRLSSCEQPIGCKSLFIKLASPSRWRFQSISGRPVRRSPLRLGYRIVELFLTRTKIDAAHRDAIVRPAKIGRGHAKTWTGHLAGETRRRAGRGSKQKAYDSEFFHDRTPHDPEHDAKAPSRGKPDGALRQGNHSS
jgi:hypothetical protein